MKIKGFDKDLKCRGYQFEVGKIYEIKLPDDYELTKDDLCSDKVFHYCDSLRKVHSYYSVEPEENNRFCEVEVLGREVTDGIKCGSNKIKVIREIVGEELDTLKGLTDENIGLFDSGEHNSGDFNSENFNTCYYSLGLFGTQYPKVKIFDIETDMTMKEVVRTDWYRMLFKYSLDLIKWIENTDEEKQFDKDKDLIGGYLKTYTYKEACKNWWDKYTDKEKAVIMSMPNFDKDKFKQITGIEVE